jgi:seryl-tRNA(Sec) selenium transferase
MSTLEHNFNLETEAGAMAVIHRIQSRHEARVENMSAEELDIALRQNRSSILVRAILDIAGRQTEAARQLGDSVEEANFAAICHDAQQYRAQSYESTSYPNGEHQ